MKNRLFTFIISVCISLCMTSLAFAAIDLDLDEGPSTSTSATPLKHVFFTIKGAYDMNGKVDAKLDGSYTVTDSSGYVVSKESLSGSDKLDVKNAFTLSLEAGALINEMFGLGGGTAFQFKRAFDEPGAKQEFQFIPVYALFKILFDAGPVFPYGIVHIGYNFLFGNDEFKTVPGYTWSGDPIIMDLKGGLYWGIGGGLMLSNRIQFEIFYSQNNGKATVTKTNTYWDSSYGDYLDEKFTVDGTIKYRKISISVGYTF